MAFLKSFENGRVMQFRKMLNRSSGTRDNLISSKNNKAPNEGTEILPRGIENVKTLLATLVEVKVLVKRAANVMSSRQEEPNGSEGNENKLPLGPTRLSRKRSRSKVVKVARTQITPKHVDAFTGSINVINKRSQVRHFNARPTKEHTRPLKHV